LGLADATEGFLQFFDPLRNYLFLCDAEMNTAPPLKRFMFHQECLEISVVSNACDYHFALADFELYKNIFLRLNDGGKFY
jgi:hypothetical protein